MLFSGYWNSPVFAQVTGSFFPTAVGEIQEPGFSPFPQINAGQTLATRQLAQLESELNFQRRPFITLGSTYANQSLMQTPGQMDSLTPSYVQAGFYPTKQLEVRLSYIPTIFGTARLQRPHVFGEEYRAAFHYQPTNRLRVNGQVGIYHYSGTDKVRSGENVLGVLASDYTLTDRIHLTAGFRRDILGSSLLATTGLNLPGTDKVVGRVTQNLFFGVADFKPTRRTYISLFGGGGFEQGTRIQTNPFYNLGLTTSRTLFQREATSHLSAVSFNYQFLMLGWKYDLSNIGNAALQVQPQPAALRDQILISSQLGQTQLPATGKQPGVGGYFSPSIFVINSWGLGIGGRLFKQTYYRGGLGLAIGNAKTTAGAFNQTGFGGFANGAITYRISPRVVNETGAIFLQSQTTYRRAVFYNQAKYFF